MTFTVKDINALTATTSLNGGMKVAVDVPTGVGDNHNLRHITKENLFVYDASSVPTRDTIIGSGRVLNVNGLTNFLEFLAAASALMYRGAILGVSPDGSTIPARLQSDGTVYGQSLALANGAFNMTVTSATGTATAVFRESGDIAMMAKSQYVTPTSGNIINASEAGHRLLYIDPAGTLATLTVNFFVGTYDGQQISIYTSEALSALSLVIPAGGATIQSAVTTLAAGGRITYAYVASENVWVPINIDQQAPSAYRATAVSLTPNVGDRIIEVTASGQTITLPSAAAAIAGYEYAIDNSSGGDITVDTEGAQTIQGLATQTVPTQSCMNVYSNGTNWRIK